MVRTLWCAFVVALVVAACNTKKDPKACKSACFATGEKTKKDCGEVASRAELEKMTSDQQAAHDARRQCHIDAIDQELECSKSCEK